MSEPLVLRSVRRTYRGEGGDLPILRGVDLTLRAGEIVALVAPSGAGKSTLLHVAGLLDRPDGGAVVVQGRDAGTLPDAARTAVRRDTIGFVYQFHHLLAEFTALENVMLPQVIAGVTRRAAAERAGALLGSLGLAQRTGHLPGKLSGGEKQRVAIARTLVTEPALLLMDEPFGALDEQTRMLLGEELLLIQQARGQTVLFVTHSINESIMLSDRVALMSRSPGRIKDVLTVGLPHPRSPELIAAPEFGALVARAWDSLREEALARPS